MNIIPTPERRRDLHTLYADNPIIASVVGVNAPMPHPAWCDREHGETPLHSGQVGADLELSSDLSYAVYLQQVPGEPAEVHLMRHDPEETSFTRLSILEASILRDLLGEGLGQLAREAGLR